MRSQVRSYTRRDGTKVRQHDRTLSRDHPATNSGNYRAPPKPKPGSKDERRTLFDSKGNPKHKQIITFISIPKSSAAARRMKRLYKNERTDKQRLADARSLLYASNRAAASARRSDITKDTRKRLRAISKVYKNASDELFKDYEAR